MNLLRRTLESAREASLHYGYIVHYALKANFEERILECIRQYGFGIDAVSGNEVKYAIEHGFPASSIAYAGVGKSDREIRYAIEQGIFAFNCESRQELEVINAFAAEMGKVADVALRINPDVDPMTHKHISTGQADSKFGISYQEIDELCNELDSMHNIRITGLHFHVGSQVGELKVFEYLCKRVNTLYEWFRDRGFNFTQLNMGGGLAVEYKHPDNQPIPDFAAYCDIFHVHLRVDPSLEIHFELGRSLVAQCGELISRVMFNKVTSGGKNVALLDASMTELLRPALYQARHAIENLEGDGRDEKMYTIGGTVCESSDTFVIDKTLPELHRGDLVAIKTAGAYGSAMASRYNLHDLPRSVYWEER